MVHRVGRGQFDVGPSRCTRSAICWDCPLERGRRRDVPNGVGQLDYVGCKPTTSRAYGGCTPAGASLRAAHGQVHGHQGISTDNGADAIQWNTRAARTSVPDRVGGGRGLPPDREPAHGPRRGRDLDRERRPAPAVGLVGRRQPEVPAGSVGHGYPVGGQAQWPLRRRPGVSADNGAERSSGLVGRQQPAGRVGPAAIVADTPAVLDVRHSTANGAGVIQWRISVAGTSASASTLSATATTASCSSTQEVPRRRGRHLDCKRRRGSIQWSTEVATTSASGGARAATASTGSSPAQGQGRGRERDLRADDGAGIIQWDWWGGQNQQFRL